MADMDKHDRIVWIDLEMTGLDIHEHTIVEVAALITDADLNVLGEGVDVVVHASEEELGRMNEFVTNMHESSGLLAEIRESIRELDFYRRVLFVANPRNQACESAQAAAIERYQEYLQP